jgi:hypothetical protein
VSSQVRPNLSPTVLLALVATLIFGAGVLGSAALAGSITLTVIGVVLVLAAAAGSAAMTRPSAKR